MEDLKEVARLILLQVDHNRECGKDDKFTLEEIADIVDRRVVKLFLIPPVIGQLPQICEGCSNYKEQCQCLENSRNEFRSHLR